MEYAGHLRTKSWGVIKVRQDFAYVGLEKARSLSKKNNVKDYWTSRMFLVQEAFRAVMSRDKFRKIRSVLRFYHN